MNRLPKRFEDELLSRHWVYYCEANCLYMQKLEGDLAYNVSPYEIAAIGLKDVMSNGYSFIQDPYDGEYVLNGAKRIASIDFCECIFKAIREVYK